MKKILYVVGKVLVKIDGIKNSYKRASNLKKLGIKSDDNIVVGADVNLAYPQNILVGKNTYINGGDILASPNAKIKIGSNCLISYYVHMRTDSHCYIDPEKLIREQGHQEKDIIIGNDVWIGYGAQIMSGVTVADGCVIAAGAIVTHDTVPYGVYAGIPAKKIKERGKA